MSPTTIDWQKLFNSFSPRLRRTAFSLLGDQHEAEDVAQEALLRAWVHLPQLRHPAALRPWLIRVVRNVAADRVRSRRRRRQILERLGRERVEAEPSDRRAVLPERCPEFQEAVSGLTHVQRQAFLAELRGRSPMEAAAEAGVTVSAAKTRLDRKSTRLKPRHVSET